MHGTADGRTRMELDEGDARLVHIREWCMFLATKAGVGLAHHARVEGYLIDHASRFRGPSIAGVILKGPRDRVIQTVPVA